MLSGYLYHAKETSEAHWEGGALRDNEEIMKSVGISVAQAICGIRHRGCSFGSIASYALAER